MCSIYVHYIVCVNTCKIFPYMIKLITITIIILIHYEMDSWSQNVFNAGLRIK